MTQSIDAIAKALLKGDIARAAVLRKKMGEIDLVTEVEILEVARQAIISFLKKGDIYNAREISIAFDIERDMMDETVRQAFMSSFREGDMEVLAELRDGLPIPSTMAKELIDYSSSWGDPRSADLMKTVLA
ncbi:MAG: hypothetical protein Q8L64_05250 [bacterium]|nr:hypothetical protein [bacterium]